MPSTSCVSLVRVRHSQSRGFWVAFHHTVYFVISNRITPYAPAHSHLSNWKHEWCMNPSRTSHRRWKINQRVPRSAFSTSGYEFWTRFFVCGTDVKSGALNKSISHLFNIHWSLLSLKGKSPMYPAHFYRITSKLCLFNYPEIDSPSYKQMCKLVCFLGGRGKKHDGRLVYRFRSSCLLASQ